MTTIIFLTPLDFDKLPLRKLLIPLSQNNMFKIYIINRPADLIIDPLKGFKRLRKRFSNKNENKETIKVLYPFVFFNEVIHESLCGWSNFNMKMLIWQVKRFAKMQNVEHDKLILWCYSPFHWKVMEEIPAKRKIYAAEDECCYNQKDRFLKKAYNAEQKMISFSDEILCVSERLKEKYEKVAPAKKIHLLSVHADNRSFQECKVKEFLPWDIIPSPKVVIFGLIRRQTDLALIEKLALKIPKVSIVFIGPVQNPFGKNQDQMRPSDFLVNLKTFLKFKSLLRNYQNIYHLGFLARDKVIYCLRSATLGLYPAKKCKFSTYANPIRIYEYAAAGIPVVSINISRESDYPNSITIVKNDTEFVTAVQDMLMRKTSTQDRKELVQFAKKHSANEIVRGYIRIFQTANSTSKQSDTEKVTYAF